MGDRQSKTLVEKVEEEEGLCGSLEFLDGRCFKLEKEGVGGLYGRWIVEDRQALLALILSEPALEMTDIALEFPLLPREMVAREAVVDPWKDPLR